jgi:hypothetical protein
MRILTRADAQIASIRPPENPFAANSLTAALNILSRVPIAGFADFDLGSRRYSNYPSSKVSKS